MNLIRGLFLLLFLPDRFARHATEDAVKHELRENPEHINMAIANFPPQIRANIEASMRGQANRFRQRILGGVAITGVTIVVGVVAGIALRTVLSPVKILVYTFQGVGAALILGATLAEAGREIETYGRRSLPERINAFAFRALYAAGTFCFVMSVAWDA
jgi:hypothetical protein